MPDERAHPPAPPTAPDPASPATPRRRRFRDVPIFGIWAQPAAWGGLLYFGAVGLALATLSFTWCVSLGSLTLGSMPLIVGPLLLAALLGSVRGLSMVEGKVAECLLGTPMPRRTLAMSAGRPGFWGRVLGWFRDVRSWLSLAFCLGNFPASVILFSLTVPLLALSVSFLAIPVMYVLDFGIGTTDGTTRVQLLGITLLPDPSGRYPVPGWMVLPAFLIGLALMTALLWLVRGLGWAQGRVVQVIQVARPRWPEPASIPDVPAR